MPRRVCRDVRVLLLYTCTGLAGVVMSLIRVANEYMYWCMAEANGFVSDRMSVLEGKNVLKSSIVYANVWLCDGFSGETK